MSDDTHIPRRTILQTAAAVAAAQLLSTPAQAAAAAKAATGKAGEFDFLTGEWRIRHRRLKTPGGADWDLFEGEATCWSILDGVASIEELRIPARNFAGMGVRVLDAEKRIWSDHWVNARVGVLGTPGLTGTFENGVGTFTADDKDGDQPIIVRGVWDRITKTGCRWHQAVSRDAGRTWAENWWMDWTRA